MNGGRSVGFEPRVALASLSGRSDAVWAEASAEHVGAAFLGGIALDEETRNAAREMVRRDREEFLPVDPIAFVDEQLAEFEETSLKAGFNLRSATLEPVREVAAVCRERGAICEINAHCRQEEMCAAGTGEALLRDPDRLDAQVRAAAGAEALVSVKVRAEVEGVDLVYITRRISAAGASIVHVDAMDSKRVVAEIAESGDLFVIANNGVRDEHAVREYLSYGADAVSVGRASDKPRVLQRVRRATDAWFAEEVPA